MKRTIEVWLGGGNIVLKSTWNRLEHLVNKTERGIALKLGIDDNSNRVEVIYLIKSLVKSIHFSIKAVNRLYSSLKFKINFILPKFFDNSISSLLKEVTTLSILIVNSTLYLVVSHRIEVIQA